MRLQDGISITLHFNVCLCYERMKIFRVTWTLDTLLIALAVTPLLIVQGSISDLSQRRQEEGQQVESRSMLLHPKCHQSPCQERCYSGQDRGRGRHYLQHRDRGKTNRKLSMMHKTACPANHLVDILNSNTEMKIHFHKSILPMEM